MTIITTPPLLLDSAGNPANGYLIISQTSRFTADVGLVTQTRNRGVIRNGQLFSSEGSGPLEIPATPTGQAVELWEVLFEVEQSGRATERTTRRVVQIPDLVSVAYADLVDVETPPSSGPWIVPPYVAELLADVELVDEAVVAAEASAAAAAVSAAEAAASGGMTAEGIQDMLSTFLVAGTNVTLSYNDVAGTLTISASGSGTLDAEGVRDTMAAALVAGAKIGITVDDTGDTITITTTATVNQTDAFLLNRDNHTDGTTYKGFTATEKTKLAGIAASALDAEGVRDAMGTALVAGTNVTITVNDAGDTITIAASGGGDPAVLASKVAHPTTWAASTAYAEGDYVVVNSTGVIFRVMTAHTSGSTAPTAATSQPTDPLSNYYDWAGPGNSPGSLVRRSSANEVTVDMAYILDAPTVPTSGVNLAALEAAVAAVTPPPRPRVGLWIVWNGSAWTYNGAVITAQPSDREAGDGAFFVGNTGGSLPAWALTNDVHIGG